MDVSSILPLMEGWSKNQTAMALARFKVESNNFQTLEENLHYKAETLLRVFPKHFNSLQDAQAYAGNPEKTANRIYANRMGNGDEASGDGWKYRGRGIIQVTGKSNYQAYSQWAGVGAINNPSLMLNPNSAIWFLKVRVPDFFRLADMGDVEGCVKLINGGTNGLDATKLLYNQFLQSSYIQGII